ncbi:MAG: cytochrome c3 family protein [Spirochaetia bacterium]|nr:cytochrome c3 family protein [Spirochaetia bacterium]
MIRILYLTAALITVFFLIYKYPKQTINPGNLSKGHTKLEENCLKCHDIFQGISSEKCISCHKPKNIGHFTVDGTKVTKTEDKKKILFHASLSKETCGVCHTDHAGLEPKILIREFSHDVLELSLQKNCTACHQIPADSLHEKNQQCLDCHDTRRWLPAKFNHTKYFRFDRHHPSRCKDCHLDKDYKKYTCYSCHEHSPRKIEREHIEEGIRDYEKCELCHRSGDEHEAERIWKSGKYDHLRNPGSKNPGRKYKKEHADDDDDEHEDHDDDD